MPKHRGPSVPSAPFVAWLNRQLAALELDRRRGVSRDVAPRSALAFRLGVSERTLYDYLRGLRRVGRSDYLRVEADGTFPREQVEAMLWRVDLRLDDIYSEADLEPTESAA